VCKNHTVSGVKEIGGRLRASPELCVLITTIFASPELRVPMTTICLFLFFVLFCFVFVDLTQYCAILCSNILTVAETHKKHVLHINPSDVVSFPDFGLIMVTCLLKKKERERDNAQVVHALTQDCRQEELLRDGIPGSQPRLQLLHKSRELSAIVLGYGSASPTDLRFPVKQGGLPLPSVNKTTLIS